MPRPDPRHRHAPLLPNAPALQVTSPSGGRLDVTFDTPGNPSDRPSSPPLLQYDGDLYAMTGNEPYLLPKEMQWYGWDWHDPSVLGHVVVTVLPGQQSRARETEDRVNKSDKLDKPTGSLPIITMGRDIEYPDRPTTLLQECQDTDINVPDWVNSTASQVTDETVSLADTLTDSAEVLPAPFKLPSYMLTTQSLASNDTDAMRELANSVVVDEEFARLVGYDTITDGVAVHGEAPAETQSCAVEARTPESPRLTTPEARSVPADVTTPGDIVEHESPSQTPSLIGDHSMEAGPTINTLVDYPFSPGRATVDIASRNSASACFRTGLDLLRDQYQSPHSDCGRAGSRSPIAPRLLDFGQNEKTAPMTPRKSASQDSRKFDIFGASTCSPQWGTAEAPFQVSLDSPVSSGSSDGDHQVQSDNSEGGLARPRVLTPEAAHEVTTNIAKSFDPTRSPAMLFPSPATIAPGCLHTVMTRELPQPPPPVARSDGSRPPIASPQHGRFKRPFYPIETSNVRGATTPSPVRSQSGMMPSSPMVPQSSCHTLSMQLAQATQRPLNPVCGSSSAIVPLTNSPDMRSSAPAHSLSSPTQNIWLKGPRVRYAPAPPNKKFVPPARVPSKVPTPTSVAPDVTRDVRTPPRQAPASLPKTFGLQGPVHPLLMPPLPVTDNEVATRVAPQSGSPGYKRQMSTIARDDIEVENQLLSSPLAGRNAQTSCKRALNLQRSNVPCNKGPDADGPVSERAQLGTVEPKKVMSDTVGPEDSLASLASTTAGQIESPRPAATPEPNYQNKTTGDLDKKIVKPTNKRAMTGPARGSGRGRGRGRGRGGAASNAPAREAPRNKTTAHLAKKRQKADDSEPPLRAAKKQKRPIPLAATPSPSCPSPSSVPVIELPESPDPIAAMPAEIEDDVEVKAEALDQIAGGASDVPPGKEAPPQTHRVNARSYSTEEMTCIREFLGPDPKEWSHTRLVMTQLLEKLTECGFENKRSVAALGIKVRTLKAAQMLVDA